MTRRPLAVNVVAFQGAWLGAVSGAAADLVWIGPAAAVAAATMHLAFAKRPARELVAIAAVTALGTAWDAFAAAAGLIDYRGGIGALGGAPVWIAALWLAFATTLNASLRWLRSRLAVAVALGSVGGPLSYAAAERLGALTFPAPMSALAVQAVAWAILLPAALALASRFDGFAAASFADERR